jgi:hypothetical protein
MSVRTPNIAARLMQQTGKPSGNSHVLGLYLQPIKGLTNVPQPAEQPDTYTLLVPLVRELRDLKLNPDQYMQALIDACKLHNLKLYN